MRNLLIIIVLITLCAPALVWGKVVVKGGKMVIKGQSKVIIR